MSAIENANLEPNIKWFIGLHSDSSTVYANCFPSLADAQNNTNKIAFGWTQVLGFYIEIILTQSPGSPQTLGKFDSEISWHLVVSSGANEPYTIYQAGPWSDMDPVKHAIYQNRNIISYRAAALIDEATKLDTRTSVSYVGTIYNLEPNDTVRINSSFLSKDHMTTVREITYELSPSAMLMSVTMSKFDQITR